MKQGHLPRSKGTLGLELCETGSTVIAVMSVIAILSCGAREATVSISSCLHLYQLRLLLPGKAPIPGRESWKRTAEFHQEPKHQLPAGAPCMFFRRASWEPCSNPHPKVSHGANLSFPVVRGLGVWGKMRLPSLCWGFRQAGKKCPRADKGPEHHARLCPASRSCCCL